MTMEKQTVIRLADESTNGSFCHIDRCFWIIFEAAYDLFYMGCQWLALGGGWTNGKFIFGFLFDDYDCVIYRDVVLFAAAVPGVNAQ